MENDGSRGILTSADKEWLRGETDYEFRQSEAKRRSDIRERVSSAMQDFTFLIEHWSPEERKKALEGVDLECSASEIIKFLYIALNEPAQDAANMTDPSGVDRALLFRRALSKGIRDGKCHFGNSPELVLIDANTELFEVPSKEDIKQAIETDQWRDADTYVGGSYDSQDDDHINQDEAAQNFHMELHLAIERELYSRRQRSDVDISRHDTGVGSTGLLGNNQDR